MKNNMNTMDTYIEQLTHLHVSHSGGFKAPHKAVLMISVTELVRDLIIGSPVVLLTNTLRDRFKENWYKYIQINTPFTCNIMMPFPRMGTEKFVVASTEKSFEIDRELFYLIGIKLPISIRIQFCEIHFMHKGKGREVLCDKRCYNLF